MATKYVFVTGGVVSGLGKGITASVLGGLLKARGLKVRNQKFDPYLNVDPALMSPIQHGEIFITEDGAETDLDIGHYERFTDVNLTGESDITSGMVYRDVIQGERRGIYNGGTVQVVPHVINEIKEHIFNVGKTDDCDVVISEIGGTVGDMEGQPYIEAIRQVSYQVGRENCLFIHVTLLPYLRKSKELKTKPTQHSVQRLLSFGVQPDILVCRTEVPMDESMKKKLALYCSVPKECVFENIDKDTVYELPMYFEEQGLAKQVLQRLNIPSFVEPDLSAWERIVQHIAASHEKIRVAICGKYNLLPDAYYSVLEALDHAGIQREQQIKPVFIDPEPLTELSEAELQARFKDVDAILLPGGFGPRGMEGMIVAAGHARKHNIPFLGIGLGMQMAVVEIARHEAGIVDAHSDECEHACSDIFYYAGLSAAEREHIDTVPFPDQPMRRGSYTMVFEGPSMLRDIYRADTARERHHHRREFNPAWQGPLLAAGLKMSAFTEELGYLEAIEWPGHPFFIGMLAHPEFTSRPTRVHPLFDAYLRAAMARRQQREKH